MERPATEVIVCHMCPGVEMEDDGEWFICPCCRSRTRGRVREQARREAHARELGLTWDQYRQHMDEEAKKIISTEPIPDEIVQAFVKKMRAEWTPACIHDKNPWGDDEEENPF